MTPQKINVCSWNSTFCAECIYRGRGVCAPRPRRELPMPTSTQEACPRMAETNHREMAPVPPHVGLISRMTTRLGSITRTLGWSFGEFSRITTTVPPHVGLISRMTTRLARLLARLAGRRRVFPHHDQGQGPSACEEKKYDSSENQCLFLELNFLCRMYI
jgi:hypothetical protein